MDIYIKNTFRSFIKNRINCELPQFEDLWIKVSTDASLLVKGIVYRHPSYTANKIGYIMTIKILHFITLFQKNVSDYVFGDFNFDPTKLSANMATYEIQTLDHRCFAEVKLCG